MASCENPGKGFRHCHYLISVVKVVFLFENQNNLFPLILPFECSGNYLTLLEELSKQVSNLVSNFLDIPKYSLPFWVIKAGFKTCERLFSDRAAPAVMFQIINL